jgi:hypothetical protein
LLAGCATDYALTLMPRDSGQRYAGEAISTGGDEAEVTIVIGPRISAAPARTTGAWSTTCSSGPSRRDA